MHTFNVSRQTLREALRVLEVQGLLEIRAGSGGGAFVAEVDLETAQMGLINFFHDKNSTLPPPVRFWSRIWRNRPHSTGRTRTLRRSKPSIRTATMPYATVN